VEIREIVFKWCIVVEELLYFIYIWWNSFRVGVFCFCLVVFWCGIHL